MTSSSTPFHFDAGRLCLDFVATAKEHANMDGLDGEGALEHWIDAAGLSAPLTPVTDEDLDHVRTLRRSFARILRHELDTRAGSSPDTHGLVAAATVINHFASVEPPVVRLVGGTSDRGLEVLTENPLGIEALLGSLSRDFLGLLGDPTCRERLRRCEAADCRQVFMQPRLGRGRRWCSGQRCGARSRVAAYRARGARRSPARRQPLASLSA